MDYRWWVLIHLVGVFGFAFAHGVSGTVLFKLRGERDRERIRSLLQLSGSTVVPMYASIGLLLAGGIGAAVEGRLWGQLWISLSLGLLVAVTLAMIVIARPYYRRLKEATASRPSGVPRVSDEELAARLASPVPLIVATVGFGGLFVILWMMVFKQPA
jgi:uncharacterized membrane protein